MRRKSMLPIGVEDFRKIRTNDFYYVDKTGLIKELLENWGEVNLFTRPRRFGKSLNMSMLKTFFEYGCDPSLFEGLSISGEKELCERYQGQFPVISISLKNVSGDSYPAARILLTKEIVREAKRFQFLLQSERLTEIDKEEYRQLLRLGGGETAEIDLMDSLRALSSLLCTHYQQKVILLIDEYDVPLEKAHQDGYYEKMILLVRNLFGMALKTNDSLHFAVLTGCLRISKESIFTGLNNPNVLSITDVEFEEYFGFTDTEVREMLQYFDLEEYHKRIKSWYDGYRFGKAEVYCPWDVINYVKKLRANPQAEPEAFWLHTSGNHILKAFLEKAGTDTMAEIDSLVNGECVVKKITQELTYKELYDSIDNLWSVLFMTGYLTHRGQKSGRRFLLAIPNLEIKQIFVEEIQNWFDEAAHRDTPTLDAFCGAFWKADAGFIEKQMNRYLEQIIGIHDYSIRQDLKENYYHGLLVGLLRHREGWQLSSNAESGEGYSDILIEIPAKKIGIIIELKYPADGNMEETCRQALRQIKEQHYESRLLTHGMTSILQYGIAFYKKGCRVALQR